MQLAYNDLVIVPNKVSMIRSRGDINPFVLSDTVGDLRLPIVSAPMDAVVSLPFFEIAIPKIHTAFTCRFLPLSEQIDHIHAGASPVIGLDTSDEQIRDFIDMGSSAILLDIANAGNGAVIEKLRYLQWIREEGLTLWAGNVAHENTYAAVAPYCDYIRVGIGGGAGCTTRINTGIGASTPMAIKACRAIYDEAETSGFLFAKIVADGGFENNGDICKALALGAHLVMLGKLFAATTEAGTISTDADLSKGRKKYRGLASAEVNKKAGPVQYIEGDSGYIKCTGGLASMLSNFEGNLRSMMSYIGASSLREVPLLAEIDQVSPSFQRESMSRLELSSI